jgi:hypothetical protein
MDVYSTELGIRLSFVKTSKFRGGINPLPPRYATVAVEVWNHAATPNFDQRNSSEPNVSNLTTHSLLFWIAVSSEPLEACSMECREQMTVVLIGERPCNVVPAIKLAASCTVQLCIHQLSRSVTNNATRRHVYRHGHSVRSHNHH